MIRKYLATVWSNTITEVRVYREAEHFVVLYDPYCADGIGKKEIKFTDGHGYFDTWGEAKRFLFRKAKDALHRASIDFEHSLAIYQQIEDMKE